MAKNRKYIIGSGIAISPEKDMALFKKMSKQGWHMSGTMLSWYRFEKGEPADYDYASNMESKVTKDMLSIYEESGWMPIVACNGFQIFRAKEGATPIFSDKASEIEALEEINRGHLKWSAIWGLGLILFVMIEIMLPNFGVLQRPILTFLSIFIVAPFAINLVSFFGVRKMLKMKRKYSNMQ